ncbi:uncharacterized protein LOC125953366 [Anopheles darlingi]|uniref:uncharacterized protein LOC125953366 n=1 Tax=Anopheles darlingi TaxID=43151 RepID=UPI0021004044|nr:uncharacterized protein LOC125953366 [Anopheles darlingi]
MSSHGSEAVLLLLILCFARASWCCVCVPERLCPAPDVDLRLVDSDCPPGELCCDDPMVEQPAINTGGQHPADSCNGVCVMDESQCPDSDLYDEYGSDTLDIRLVADGDECPRDYICCGTSTMPPKVPQICNGTCVAPTMCTMFEPSAGEGCPADQVCCRMNRISWSELVNDINSMDLGHTREPPSTSDRCAVTMGNSFERLATPAWFLSIWAQVEVAQGFFSDQYLCAGALLSPDLVLTLSSCVERISPDRLFVNLGDDDLSNRFLLQDSNIYTIEKVTTHEDYRVDPVRRNVALLHLTTKIRRNASSCFATFTEKRPTSGGCYIVGWNKDALASGTEAVPRRYQTTLGEDSANDLGGCMSDLVCFSNGANCDDRSMSSAALLCDQEGGLVGLHALLLSNCTGLPLQSLANWIDHQRDPSFVQKVQPPVPSRNYLPL